MLTNTLRGEVDDGPASASTKRVEGTDDVVRDDAEVEREVIARAGMHA